MEDSNSYTDEDYKNGIVLLKPTNNVRIWHCVGCDSSFKESTFNDIKIGSVLNDVVSILGKPNYSRNDLHFFVSDEETYIIIKGKEKVENIFFTGYDNKQFDPDILRSFIADIIQKSDPRKDLDFFNLSYNKYQVGGYTYDDTRGIFAVKTENNNKWRIDVYQNFTGNIYKVISNSDITINYINIDYFASIYQWIIDKYLSNEENFKKNGLLSPDKKYSVMTTSEYFTAARANISYIVLKHMDHSKPDLVFGASLYPHWLNNDTLVYVDFVDGYNISGQIAVWNVSTNQKQIVRVPDKYTQLSSNGKDRLFFEPKIVTISDNTITVSFSKNGAKKTLNISYKIQGNNFSYSNSFIE